MAVEDARRLLGPGAIIGLSIKTVAQAEAAPLDLLDYALARQTPTTFVLERDDRLDAVDEILNDLARLRARLDRRLEEHHAESAPGSAE
jgi:thiamine-phosphate pyrophosphorylase